MTDVCEAKSHAYRYHVGYGDSKAIIPRRPFIYKQSKGSFGSNFVVRRANNPSRFAPKIHLERSGKRLELPFSATVSYSSWSGT